MSKKWDCPTCGKAGIPKGMHCRSCLCDILGNTPIGTTRRYILDERNAKRRERLGLFKPLRFRSLIELYETI
jgi:hypothetical protein